MEKIFDSIEEYAHQRKVEQKKCTVGHADGMCYCVEEKPTHNTREWEEPLMHIMESYIMTAELGHLVKDQVKHKQELRAYYAELVDFLHQELQKARHDCLLEAIEKIEIARQEHNDARHGDSIDDAYDRACDAINPDLHQSELDQTIS